VIYFLGVATEEIADGADGKVTHFGKVRDIDTSAYAEGAVLYISTTASGQLTDVEPTSGMNLPVAFVINSHESVGTIAVRVKNIDVNAFATAAQGDLATTAVQPADLGTAASENASSFAPSVSISVTVADTGSGNRFFLDGAEQQLALLTPSVTYRFDQSDPSNTGHPLRFSTTSDGTHSGGAEFTTGVVTSGTPGSPGAYTEITLEQDGPLVLYYYCTNHSGMGSGVNRTVSQTQFDTAVQPADLSPVATSGSYNDLTNTPSIPAAGTDFVAKSGGTFTGDVTFGAAIDETVYALSGTSPALDPANGTIQTHTLSGNTTYSDSFSDGEAITLMIDDGSAFTVTWPPVTWKTDGGDPPTLNETGLTAVVLWKVGTTLHAARVGDN